MKKDEFEVTQISVYQIVEGVDFQVLGFAGGDLDELGENLPEKFDNYGKTSKNCNKGSEFFAHIVWMD